MRVLSLLGFVLLSSWFAGSAIAADTDRGLVLTALPVTYNITSRLLSNTDVDVENLPARGSRLGGLPRYFESQAEALAETYDRADALVSIGKLWADDPLYMAARAGNIRVIEIDATRPWSNTLEGISVAREPMNLVPWAVSDASEPGGISLWYWLSLSNAVRSTDIIAADLKRIFPEATDDIASNQLALRTEFLDLQRRAQRALTMVLDNTVFSLAAELVYFTSELSLYVDGQFYKQDIDWTDSDLASFTAYLEDHDIKVVLHKWEPDPPIAKAIEDAGAELVVIETLDAGITEDGQMQADSYLRLMRSNLEKLILAFGGEGTL